MRRLVFLMAAACLSCSDRVLANDLPADTYRYQGFDFSGYLEPSYNYLSRSNHFISSGIHDRLFDLEPNGFTLQQAAITVAKEPQQGLGGLLNLILGRDANTLAPAGVNPNVFHIQNIGLTSTQAYVIYTHNGFSFLVGQYNCPMGPENYNPLRNSNFSHSFLDDYAQAGTFIGAKASYALDDYLDLSVDVNNGWDTIKYTSRRKSIELNANYVPSKRLRLAVTGTNGEQPIVDGASSGPTGVRNAFDLVGAYRLTDKLDFKLNYDYGTQSRAKLPQGIGTAVWHGSAVYFNYQWNDRWQGSLRTEIFSDRNGYRTGAAQCLKDLSLTLAYHVCKKLQVRAETRHDISNVKSFVTRNGKSANTNQQSFALEALYKF